MDDINENEKYIKDNTDMSESEIKKKVYELENRYGSATTKEILYSIKNTYLDPSKVASQIRRL